MVPGPWHDVLDGINSDHSDSHPNTSVLEMDRFLNIFAITPALDAWIQSGKSDSPATWSLIGKRMKTLPPAEDLAHRLPDLWPM